MLALEEPACAASGENWAQRAAASTREALEAERQREARQRELELRWDSARERDREQASAVMAEFAANVVIRRVWSVSITSTAPREHADAIVQTEGPIATVTNHRRISDRAERGWCEHCEEVHVFFECDEYPGNRCPWRPPDFQVG